ncbi:hypothetical protein LX36DRAFT_423163 [Colletotrichum falcatum]|nr:hypothetical protein LX36DRAFT_423163 [Colletotrichum falcatum]
MRAYVHASRAGERPDASGEHCLIRGIHDRGQGMQRIKNAPDKARWTWTAPRAFTTLERNNRRANLGRCTYPRWSLFGVKHEPRRWPGHVQSRRRRRRNIGLRPLRGNRSVRGASLFSFCPQDRVLWHCASWRREPTDEAERLHPHPPPGGSCTQPTRNKLQSRTRITRTNLNFSRVHCLIYKQRR